MAAQALCVDFVLDSPNQAAKTSQGGELQQQPNNEPTNIPQWQPGNQK